MENRAHAIAVGLFTLLLGAGVVLIVMWFSGDTEKRETYRLESPFAVTKAASRERLEHGLRANPLARGALIALAATAAVALALALLGIALAVVTDLRDERGELEDLEAQGVEPRGLRRHVRLRSLTLLGAGLLGGLATAVALSLLVASLVAVTAAGGVPVPSLLLGVDWPLALASVGALALGGAAIVLGVTGLAFRERA